MEDPNVAESLVDVKRMETLMTENLSGSQLDLVMHGEGDPFAPGHSKKINQNELNKTFIESERVGGIKLPKSVVSIENGAIETETSTL